MSVTQFKDGGVHDITTLINDGVWVDYGSDDVGTTINLLNGGEITYFLKTYEDSMVNISGGSVNGHLFAYDNSQVDISGGSVDGYLYTYDSSRVNITGESAFWYLRAEGSSQVDISGGAVDYSLYTLDSSQVNITGGSVGWNLGALGNSQVNIYGGFIGDSLYPRDYATISIHGWGFAVDGEPVGPGTTLTTVLGGSPPDEPPRYLTGTLASGEPFGNAFYIYEYGQIQLVPEPCTLSLLALGGLALRRRRVNFPK